MRNGPGQEAADRTRARQWLYARLSLWMAGGWLALATVFWLVDDAPRWQAVLFSIVGVVYSITSVVNWRQQRRLRQGGPDERAARWVTSVTTV